VRELEVRLEEQGLKMERYLQYTNTSLDVLQAEQRPQAVQKVRLELALETVAEREGLTVSDAEVEEAVTNALAEEDHTGHQHGDLRGADPVRAYFRHQLLMRKTVDFLSAVASPESSDTMEPPSDAKELEGAGKSASRGERQTKGKKPR
jgi:trigger factor